MMSRVRRGVEPGRLWPTILIGWTVASLALCAATAPDILHLWFPDPDDAMRLVEVRDWIGGQSWWDVGQHRLNGGDFPMHWSRIVDLPLAAVIAPLNPLVGTALATRIAMVLVPLLTLLSVMALAALVTRRLLDTERARTAVLLVPLSVPLVYQMRPMRIDHHGWQVTLALGAVLALLGRPGWRSGAVLGACLALLVTISLEGLPIASAIMAMAALAWAIEPARRDQLLTAIWAWLGGAVLLHAATRGPGMFAPACDAISPGWLAALGAAAVGITLVALLAQRTRASIRIGALFVAGAGVLAALWLTMPDCLGGPFAKLDPMVRALWYKQVSEGLPVWEQVPAWAAMTVGFPIFGLAGTALALRKAEGGDKWRWGMMFGVALAGFALSLLVVRAGATANALAIPGGAWLLHEMLVRARRIERVLPRTAATAGALAVATPGLIAGVVIGFPAAKVQGAQPVAGRTRAICHHGHEVAALAQLPPGTIYAPVDISPEILATSRHRAIGAGYHRNGAVIRTVLATFLADPARARGEVVRSGATYVAGCPGVNETEMYRTLAPDGLWAQLERGAPVNWLVPIPIANSPVLAWRVIDPAVDTSSPPPRTGS